MNSFLQMSDCNLSFSCLFAFTFCCGLLYTFDGLLQENNAFANDLLRSGFDLITYVNHSNIDRMWRPEAASSGLFNAESFDLLVDNGRLKQNIGIRKIIKHRKKFIFLNTF